MNNTPDEDNNEPVLPVGNSGEAVQTPYDRLLSRTLMQTESAQELVPLIAIDLAPEA
jgi:hypothetical protein